MGEFFKGWRRMIGVVTLLMALGFMAGWVRSRERSDLIVRHDNSVRDAFVSLDGRLLFCRTTPSEQAEPVMLHLLGNNYWWHSHDVSNLNGFKMDEHGIRQPYDPFETYDVEWRRDWAGFTFGAGQMKEGYKPQIHLDCCLVIPYWSITIPVTLLSLWLLLSKPGKSTQQKISETISIEET